MNRRGQSGPNREDTRSASCFGWFSVVCLATILLVVAVPHLSATASAAAPSMAWNRTFIDEAGRYYDVRVAVSDGYVMAGSFHNGYFQSDLVLVKTDRDGNVVWNRSYYGFYYVSSLLAVDDGYVVTGMTSKYMNTSFPDFVVKSLDGYMAKFDLDGNMTWWKSYDWWTDCNVVATQVDGGYVMAGNVGSVTIVMNIPAHLAMTDPDGNEIWNRTYGRAVIDGSLIYVNESVFDAVIPSDDGCVLSGQIKSTINTMSLQTRNGVGGIDGLAWLVKMDSDGNEVWNRTYGTGRAYTVVNASDGYALLVDTAARYASPSDFHLIKTDLDGNEVWDRDLGTNHLSSLIAIPDGYVLAGHVPVNGTSQVFLMRTDRNGNQTWNATYPVSGDAADIALVADRGAYVIAGNSYYNINDTWRTTTAFLIKTIPDDTREAPATPAVSLALTAIAVIVTVALLSWRRR